VFPDYSEAVTTEVGVGRVSSKVHVLSDIH